MSDWKQEALETYRRWREEMDAQEAEMVANRIANAKEGLVAALAALNIPANEDDIRVEEMEGLSTSIPYVTVDGIEFTLGPNRAKKHGGGLGIVYTCKRCGDRQRGRYIYDQKILGMELAEPELPSHVCRTKEEQEALDAQITERTAALADSPARRLCDAVRDLADEQIQLRTGA